MSRVQLRTNARIGVIEPWDRDQDIARNIRNASAARATADYIRSEPFLQR